MILALLTVPIESLRDIKHGRRDIDSIASVEVVT
jgi:hypothetical protein